MKNKTDCLFRCQTADKIHIGPEITIRITHIRCRRVNVRISTPLGLRYVFEKRKKPKSAADS